MEKSERGKREGEKGLWTIISEKRKQGKRERNEEGGETKGGRDNKGGKRGGT